jgi:phosphocarrier protein HPr
MKKTTVRIVWEEGLHMRRAARLAQLAAKFGSSIHLKLGSRVADAKNILGVLILCATLNSPVAIETSGDDEQAALEAVATFFKERSA